MTIVNGTGPLGSAPVDLSNFHRVRIVVTPAGMTVYDLENDLDGGPGFNWAVLAGPITLGGSGAGFDVGGVPITNGALHINSLAGSSTTRSDYTLDWLRIDTGVDRGATQAIIAGPVVLCGAGVSPTGTVARSGFENGIAPAPSPVNYNFNNLSSTNTITGYTVTEVDGLGVATDHSWITLTGATGNINPSSSAAVTANLSTGPSPNLPAGNYTGYLKFDDTCGPSSPCFNTDFNNPPYTQTGGTGGTNALVGQDSWAGSAANTAINVDAANGVGGSGNVHVTSGAGEFDAHKVSTCAADGDGIISIKINAKAGATGDGSNFWHVWVYDNNTTANGGLGNVIGRWIGGNNRVSGQNGIGVAVADVALNTSTYTELEMRYYSASHQLQFFHGGSSTPDTITVGGSGTVMNSGTATSNGTVGRIRINRINRVLAGDDVMLDDMSVTVLERHIRRIDLTVLGCSIDVLEPRTLVVGPCGQNRTTTETFTIKNTGAYDWTGFTAFEFNVDRPWLSLSFTSGPVPRNGTATVNAIIDWSQVPLVPTNQHVATIRFGGTCDGTNFVFDTPANTLSVVDNNTSPQVVKYEGNVSPLDPDSGGAGISFVLTNEVGNADQGTIVSDVGVDGAVDGVAYRVVDGPGAKTRWRSTPGAEITNLSGSTVVARVKTISALGTAGGNVFVFADPITAGAHWAGPGNLVIETERGASAAVIGDNKYHIIRLTSQDLGGALGRVIRIYVDENATPALEITNAAAAAPNAAGIDSIGFGASSTAGEQEIYFDCVYGTNAGAFAPGEEEACLGESLVCVPDCNHPFADADPAPEGDGDVDMNDYALFQRCYTGSNFAGSLPPECDCFDRVQTGVSANSIDAADFQKFVLCAGRDQVPWVPTVDCP
jgi:hypothetical protein